MNEPSRDLLDAVTPPPDGTVVLMLATAGQRQWAAEAAIELSARWAKEGRRIVLADLNLENPILHEGLGVENLEGITDIFLYGASLSRIARPVRDGSFYLIPAGTYAPDVEEIYNHPRWKKLLAGFRDTSAVLALFAPAESGALEAFARWRPRAVVFGPPLDEARLAEMERLGIPIAAVLPPPSAPAAGPPVAQPEPPPVEPPTVYAEDLPPVRSPSRGRAGGSGHGRSGGAAHAARGEPLRYSGPSVPGIGTGAAPAPVRRRRQRRSGSMFLVLIMLVVILGAAGYVVATLRPDLIERFFAVELPTLSQEAPAAPELPAATRQGGLLPYSVQVKAFPSLDAAREELARERDRLASVPFFIAPEEIQGIVYYKIMSGLVTDTAAAIRLRDRLVDIGAVDEEDAVGTWSLIQFTPLSYDLGEYPTLQAATERADSLLVVDIPTYPAAVDYSDGSQRWQLYAGAYPDSASAMGMRRMLTEAGVEAPLAARTGRPASLPPE